MKKLLNTLYVTSENSYLSLDGENIVVFEDKKRLAGSLYIIWKELFLLIQRNKPGAYGSLC